MLFFHYPVNSSSLSLQRRWNTAAQPAFPRIQGIQFFWLYVPTYSAEAKTTFRNFCSNIRKSAWAHSSSPRAVEAIQLLGSTDRTGESIEPATSGWFVIGPNWSLEVPHKQSCCHSFSQRNKIEHDLSPLGL
jgi:hypothetical protein